MRLLHGTQASDIFELSYTETKVTNHVEDFTYNTRSFGTILTVFMGEGFIIRVDEHH